MSLSTAKQIAAAACLFCTGLASATTYDAPLAGFVPFLGGADTTSSGQTFSTPRGILTDWTFYAGQSPLYLEQPVSGHLKLVVAKWNGSRAVGPALYVSPEYLYTFVNGGGLTLKPFNFTGINITLEAGDYITYLTVAGVSSPVENLAIGVAFLNGGTGGFGRSLYSPNVDPLTLSSTSWSPLVSGTPDLSMAYNATITNAPPIPEPASYAMMLAGLGLLASVARRRKLHGCAAKV